MRTVFDLKVGYSCNNDCIHCVVGDKRRFSDTLIEKIKQLISECSSTTVVITGGEPTIRKDFIDIVRFAKESSKEVILQTNGRKFSDKNFTNEACEYIDFVLVAIHSHNNIAHDMITQRRNSWNETIKGIENLLETKSRVQSQTVLSKLNCDNLLKTFDFIQERFNLESMNFTFPHAQGNARKFFHQVVPKYSSFKNVITKCLEKYRHKLYIEAIPLCYIHPYVSEVNLSIQSVLKDEKKGYDVSISEDSRFTNGIVDDYKDLTLDDHRKPESCKKCIYNEICYGVWKEYYEAFKDELDLIPIERINS